MSEDFTQLCKDLEFFETPEWAAEAILEKEILTEQVIDPCCGLGILTEAALSADYCCMAFDVKDWGYNKTEIQDFLNLDEYWHWIFKGSTVFMNPPFSKACEFVEKSFELGARKIVCFNRFSWWESQSRKEFWGKYPPNRVYICGDRASCWRHDIPVSKKGQRYDPETGKILSNTPTAHAWFVFEHGHAGGTLLSHIWKEDVA